MSELPPCVLTIAGSDCSAGAGLQADLKTFSALGVYGLTAVTSVIAEGPGRVDRVEWLSPDLVLAQTRLLLEQFPVDAIKTGLLARVATVRELAALLKTCTAPLVIDPVAVASAGTDLAEPGLMEALEELIRAAGVLVTPNRHEAERFLGAEITNPAAAAEKLAAEWRCAVLLKGGHFQGPFSIDYLAFRNRVVEFTAPRLDSGDVHGTGCTLSAAITAFLAQGYRLEDAVRRGKAYLQKSLQNAHRWYGPDVQPLKALAHFDKNVDI